MSERVNGLVDLPGTLFIISAQPLVDFSQQTKMRICQNYNLHSLENDKKMFCRSKSNLRQTCDTSNPITSRYRMVSWLEGEYKKGHRNDKDNDNDNDNDNDKDNDKDNSKDSLISFR